MTTTAEQMIQQWAELGDAATEGPWGHALDTWSPPADGRGIRVHRIGSDHTGNDVGLTPAKYPLSAEDADLIAASREAVPAMAKALQAVMSRWHPDMNGECHTCGDDRGPLLWPCPTVRAISEALGVQA